MTMASQDAALISSALAGSAPAFSQLVANHQQAVRGFLRRVCGNWADAEDLAQETFIAAWENLRRFSGQSTFRSWLCGIAYNKCLTAARSRGRSAARDLAFLEASDETAAPSGDDRMDLMAAMGRLPIEQRSAVALCLAAGFSHSEASEALGLPLGTVKSHVLRGKQKLLEALGDD
jgi:RNA polymerase sigma-70 factor (ECF subfamily)